MLTSFGDPRPFWVLLGHDTQSEVPVVMIIFSSLKSDFIEQLLNTFVLIITWAVLMQPTYPNLA